MKKVFVGQKVVRIAGRAGYEFWRNKCRDVGINPSDPVTVTTVNETGNWFEVKEITTNQAVHNWLSASYFEAFFEPVEASPAIVFTRAEGPITTGCMVRRKAGYLDANWNKQVKNAGLDPRGVFEVAFNEGDLCTSSILRIVSDKGHDLGRWGSAYFELVEQSPKAYADGWIEWHGGECPVDLETLVEVKYLDEKKHHIKGVHRAGVWNWRHHDIDGDIIAYRKHVKEKAEEQKLRDRFDSLERNLEEELNKRINAEREASEKIAKLESQLMDERQERMKREQLVDRLRVILGVNGREFKAMKADRDEMLMINRKLGIEVDNLNQVIANHHRLWSAQQVVIDQSRDNVKLALVLAASPDVSGDAAEALARLVRRDEQLQTDKIDDLIGKRYDVDLPF